MTNGNIFKRKNTELLMEISPKLVRYIISTTEKKIQTLPAQRRDVYNEIKKGMTILWGLRGVGKTTLMLQHLKENKGLYFKLDHFLFNAHKIYEIVDYFHAKGYTNFYLDEIHTYKNWYKELKDIYDDFDINVVASGSSAIALSKGYAYLTRRAKFIHVEPLSFREYLNLKYKTQIKKLKLKDILENPQETIAKLELKIKNLEEEFNFYVRYGGLPIVFSLDFHPSFYVQITNRILTYDLLYLNISRETILKAKQIIPFLAKSSPGEINIESISASSGISKGTLYIIFDVLKKAGLLHSITPYTKSAHSKLRKQPKFYFAHPSLRHNLLIDIGENENIGSYREEFFFSAIKNYFKSINYIKGERKNPDFIANGYLFEIGGKRKLKKEYRKEVIVVKDDINAEHPLLLFGFLN